MSKKIEVTKIVIRIGDKESELTIAQARELKDALNELLGTKETVFVPSSPVIIERPYTHPFPYWTVTWDTQTISNTAVVLLTHSNNESLS